MQLTPKWPMRVIAFSNTQFIYLFSMCRVKYTICGFIQHKKSRKNGRCYFLVEKSSFFVLIIFFFIFSFLYFKNCWHYCLSVLVQSFIKVVFSFFQSRPVCCHQHLLLPPTTSIHHCTYHGWWQCTMSFLRGGALT